MLKCKILTLIVFFGILSSNVAIANPLPYKGRINGSRVNVRGSHTISSDVMTQVKKGLDVTVIEEREGWSKIIMPYGISTWVYAPLIKNNLVNRDVINVRSGAAVHYPVLAKLKRGDVVEIIDEADGWAKITPPAGVGGWISSKYITFLASVNNYDKWLKGEKEAKIEFEKIEDFRKREMFKAIEEVDFNQIIKKYSDFIKEYGNYPEHLVARERIADAEAKKKMAIKSGSYVQHSEPVAYSTVSTPQTTSTSPSKQKVSFVGKIKKLKKPVKDANYYLRSGGLFGGNKCYVVSNDFNLAKYANQKVTIIGYALDNDKKPLVNITEIVRK